MSFMYNLENLGEEGSIRYFIDAGYSEAEAAIFYEGGFRAIPTEVILEDERFLPLKYSGDFNIFSSYCNIDLLRHYTNPTEEERKYSVHNTRYLICDSYYRRFYGVLKPFEPYAIYGTEGLRYEDWPNVNIERTEPLRVHHREIPGFVVSSSNDLNQILASLEDSKREFTYLFRGQTREHLIDRPHQINFLLFGTEANKFREPSLITKAVRENFDADDLLSTLFIDLQNFIYTDSALKEKTQQWALMITSPIHLPSDYISEYDIDNLSLLHSRFMSRRGSGGLIRELVALAQHYGIPTYGVDLTESISIAVWFATHKLTLDANGYYEYNQYIWNSEDSTKWPCIYFFGLPDWVREHFAILKSLQIDAVRPRRQKAFLSLGGWGWHKNIIAEDLVAVAYLAPDFKQQETHSFEFLFPKPQDDPFFQMLISRKRATKNTGSPFETVYRMVMEFPYDCIA